MQQEQAPPGNDLLAELEESMPQGVPNDTGHRRRASDPEVGGLDELDLLMAESVGLRDAEEQYKADRKAARSGFSGMSKEEVDYCNTRMAAFEMAKIWEAKRAIGVWQVFRCENCLRDSRPVFSRYMEYHESRVNPATNRFVTVKETKFEATPCLEVRPVPECYRCSEWDLSNPLRMTNLTEVLK